MIDLFSFALGFYACALTVVLVKYFVEKFNDRKNRTAESGAVLGNGASSETIGDRVYRAAKFDPCRPEDNWKE